jgi:hypothetical protein
VVDKFVKVFTGCAVRKGQDVSRRGVCRLVIAEVETPHGYVLDLRDGVIERLWLWCERTLLILVA